MPLNLSAFNTKEETNKKSNLNYSAFGGARTNEPVRKDNVVPAFDPTAQQPPTIRLTTETPQRTTFSTPATSFDPTKFDLSAFEVPTIAEPRKPSVSDIMARGEELRTVSEKKSTLGLGTTKETAIPPFLKGVVKQLREGLVGRGQEVDFAGNLKIDTGLLGFFRPFGIGKTDYERVTERYDNLIEAGISPKRATDISTAYAKGTVTDPLDRMISEEKKRKTIDSLKLTSKEKKAIFSVGFFESLDTAFGALDAVGLGTISKIGLKSLIKTGTAEEGFILLKRMGVSDDVAREMSPKIPDIKNEKQANIFYKELSERHRGSIIDVEAKPALQYEVGGKTFDNVKDATQYKNELENKNREFMFEPEKRVDTTIRGVEIKPDISPDLAPIAERIEVSQKKFNVLDSSKKIIGQQESSTAIPRTVKEFEAIHPDMQSKVFNQLPEELQKEIVEEISGSKGVLSELDKLADDISVGKIKVRTGRQYKTEARELLGKADYMRIFRNDPDAQPLDELVETLRRTSHPNLTIDELLESVSKSLDKQAKIRKTLDEVEQALKASNAEARTKKILDNLREKASIQQKKMIAFAKKHPELAKATLPLSEEATKGAKVGYKVGIKVAKAEATESILSKLRVSTESSQGVKNEIVAFVKENLSPSDRGKALVMVRDAKTQKDLIKAFSRINRWAEDAEKKSIRNDILKTQKKIMDSPSIAIDYKARVKELMGDFELKGHREETLERLKKTQDFIQGEIAKGNDVEIPSRVLKALEILNRTPFDEITISQLTGLKAEMELLENIGRTKFNTIESLWEIQKSKILDEITLQGSKPVTKIELIKPEIGERLTMTEKFKNLIWRAGNQASRIDKAISPMDTIFDLLDGGKGSYTGANFRFFKGRVDAGYGRYITRKDVLQEPVIGLATKHGLEDTNFERMGVVAAREQDGGMEKLIASGFTEDAINAVKLTEGEQEVLNKMRETFDSQFPEIKEIMRKVYNQPVEKVKNYFSFMTDWNAMDESEVFERFGSQLPEQYGAPRKNVEAGFTKSRVGGDQKIKINALDVFLKHTDNTSYLIELGDTTKMLGEVASSPEYAELVGDVGQVMVREWLDVVSRKGGASGASQIPLFDTLRKNVGVGILGLKLSTIAIQPTALIDGMGFIGAKYGMKGVKDFMTSPDWRKLVASMPELKDRMGGEFALRELTDDNWLQNIQRKGFIPMQKLDQLTAGMVASGAYSRKMAELGLPIDFTNINKEALEYAQLAVRRTQSSGSFKDVPLAISRGALTGNRSVDRAMLQFQNFLLTRWSRVRHDAIRAGINTKDPKKAVIILATLIMASIAASGIRLGVNKIQDFVTGRDDEDTPMEDFTRGMVYEMTGNVPFLGTAVSMAMYDGEMFPILDAPKGVVSGINRVITSKSESAKLRGLNELIGSTGALIGIPGSAQAEQLARGFLQDKKKETKPKTLKTPAELPKLPKIKSVGLPKLPKLPTI